MIQFSRHQVHSLRAVLRRHALGERPRAPAPPVWFEPDTTGGLAVCWIGPGLAVSTRIPGSATAPEPVPLPLDALADLEGRDDTPFVIDSTAPTHVRVRWSDRGIPRTAEYALTESARPNFPEAPAYGKLMPARTLIALATACRIAGEPTPRFALQCLQLRARDGEVTATDGRQLLVQQVGRWPWDGDVLVPKSPVFGVKALHDGQPVWVGRTDTHVTFRTEAWTLALAIEAKGRFPDVQDILATGRNPATTLRLDVEDLAFLAGALDRLPGGQVENAPVTLECNGRIAVRARAGHEPATEVLLSRSSYMGPPIRLACNRAYLAESLRLGLRELCFTEPARPILARDAMCRYAWQPLEPVAELPGDGAVTILSSALPVTPASTRSTMPEIPARNGNPKPPPQPESPAPAPSETPPTGMVELIREAEAIGSQIGDLRVRVTKLVAALRRQRKQDRLVRETLRSLRQIHLAGIPE